MLLQKTLLYIEGLGRQLDPELDLWDTAKPFPSADVRPGLARVPATHARRDTAWTVSLPQLPRLIHHTFARASAPVATLTELALLRERRVTNRLLVIIALVLAALTGTLAWSLF